MNQLDIRWRVKGLDDNRPCVPHCLQTVSSLRPCSSLKLGHGTWSTGTAAKIHWEKKFLLSSSNTWLSNLFHVWYDLLMLLLLFFLIWRCVENLSLCVVTKIKIFFTDFHWLRTNQVKRSFLVTFRLCVPFPLPLLKTAGHCNKSVDFLSLLKFFPRFLLPFVYKYAYSWKSVFV